MVIEYIRKVLKESKLAKTLATGVTIASMYGAVASGPAEAGDANLVHKQDRVAERYMEDAGLEFSAGMGRVSSSVDIGSDGSMFHGYADALSEDWDDVDISGTNYGGTFEVSFDVIDSEEGSFLVYGAKRPGGSFKNESRKNVELKDGSSWFERNSGESIDEAYMRHGSETELSNFSFGVGYDFGSEDSDIMIGVRAGLNRKDLSYEDRMVLMPYDNEDIDYAESNTVDASLLGYEFGLDVKYKLLESDDSDVSLKMGIYRSGASTDEADVRTEQLLDAYGSKHRNSDFYQDSVEAEQTVFEAGLSIEF